MVEKYIKENWKNCIRFNQEDDGTLMGLPYPYLVPTIEGHFQEMYYWDTYFANKGLILSDMAIWAKMNVDNMLYLVDKYGYMPGGNRRFYLKSSQPPFLSMMVRDIFEYFGDTLWLSNAYCAIEKEYDFWMSQRYTPIKLNQYKTNSTDAFDRAYFEWLKTRLNYDFSEENYQAIAKNGSAQLECGWDFTPRYNFEALKYASIDLNCLLYQLEKNMAYFSEKLGKSDVTKWDILSNERWQLMQKYLWNNETGAFMDWNFEDVKFSAVFSAASFFALFNKVASKEQAKATVENLNKIEFDFGIAACEKNTSEIFYQWDYPNAWAPLQYIVVQGLINYGYIDDSKRIAEKYIKMVDDNFEKTGKMWEKYNAVDGSINVKNEYKMPQMLGWSGGVYLLFKKILNL